MKFKQALLAEPGRFIIEEVDMEPAADQVMVKVASCGLCNWELNHWKGYIVKPGGYPFPLGHEFAGTVVKVGDAVTKFKVGDKVSGLGSTGAFAEYTLCSEEKCVLLDPQVDCTYLLGEPLKCIVTVLESVCPKAGDYGVIIGCGPMGQWCTQGLAGNLLAGLIVVDIDDRKLEMARGYGATHTINSRTENVQERIREITGGHMADFVIEGTGVHALLNDAMDYLRKGRGKLIVMSAYEEMSPNFDFRKAVNLSLDIHVPHPGHSLNQTDDLRRACDLIARGSFQVRDMITHEYKLSDIQRAFEELEHKPAGFMKGIVIPD